MRRRYRHLQFDDRAQIRALYTQGISIREIVRQLGRYKSSISRELWRNRGQRGYRHQQIQRLADERRRTGAEGPRKLTPAV